MLKQVEVERQRKVNQKGMQMYTDCTFDLRVKYNETRTNFPFSQKKRKEKILATINLAFDLVE